MAPMVTGVKDKVNNKTYVQKFKQEKKNLLQLRKFIENNFEYVGENFSKKVRDVYYDKGKNQMIYGTTTPDERKQLEEEGIDLLSVPWISKDN